MTYKKIFPFFCSLSFVFFYAAPYQAQAVPIRIGVSAPLSGPVSRFGRSTVNGVQMAIDELNKNDRSNSFEMVVEDDQCKPPLAVANIHKFQDLDKLNAMIVTCSAVAPAIAPLTKDKSIVFSGSAKVASIEDKGFEHYFCLQPAIIDDVKTLLDYAKSKNMHRLGLVITQNDFMRTYQQAIEREAANYGITIAAVAETELANTDFRSHLLQLMKNKPDAIFTALNPEALVSFVKQKNEMQDTTPVLSMWTAGVSDFLKSAGSAANGLVFIYPYNEDASAKSTKFKDSYHLRFNEDPDLSAASTYDAVFILSELYRDCSESQNTACLVEQANKLSNFEGVSGTFSFKNGSASKKVYLKVIKDGSAQFLN
jgi:branched-chain amino acid transport system substrate-binding protein